MLAGYISGATVDLAKVRMKDGGLILQNHARYVSRNFSDLESILGLYLKKNKEEITFACFGVAGPVINEEVTTTNLPWHISSASIEKRFSVNRVKLINDIVATAYGLPELSSNRFFTINNGGKKTAGNVGLIAAGSGLGEALIYSEGEEFHPYASEGGHADFSPGNQTECELWEYLYSELGHVEVEDVVSLSGLERIYTFVVDMEGSESAPWFKQSSDRPADIIEHALAGKDENASRALDIFIDCYASEAGNLALTGMTLGGIYIGGLIAPQIITALDKEALLAHMPVGVIIEEKTALLGAAAVALRM